MIRRLVLPLPLVAFALALPVPVLAQTSPQDFQLPPNPSPTPSPRVQGPVDEEAPVPVRPRVIPTARPTPAPTPRPTLTVPTPAPTSTARPQTRPGTATTPARPVQGPVQGSQPTPTITPGTPAPLPSAETAPPLAFPSSVPTTAAPFPAPVATIPAAPADDGEGTAWWLWAAALAALALAGGGAMAWKRRRDAATPPPTIARPQPHANGAPLATPAFTGAPLQLRAEAVKLTRSFAFATLDYRLTLTNRTQAALTALDVQADLVSAHGHAPMEAQVALPGTALPPRHVIARLAPGQSQQVAGQVRLPLAEAQVIRQGRLPLLIPLLRLRIDGAGTEPLTRTLVIGQGAAGTTRLQPFNLDDAPRSYQPVGQRELA